MDDDNIINIFRRRWTVGKKSAAAEGFWNEGNNLDE